MQSLDMVRQLQEKYLAANKRLYMAFVDLEKASDCASEGHLVGLRKHGASVDWRLAQGMYANLHRHVHVGEGYSDKFEVKVRVHQGSVLNPLLFINVLEAWSRKFRSGVPWRTFMLMTLLSLLNRLRNVTGGS